MSQAAKKTQTNAQDNKDVSLFLKRVWFFLMFFVLLMMIASFGLIAET